MPQITGVIKKEIPTKSSNTWIYKIQKKTGEIMTLITFNNERLMMHYNVTIKYEIKKSTNKMYPDDSNIIKSIKYGSLITDIDQIKKILEGINVSAPGINKIMKTYGDASLKKIMETLEEIKVGEDDMMKLKELKETDLIRLYIDFLTEMDVKYKHNWFDKIKKIYGPDINEIKNHPYRLYMECKIPFKEVDKIGLKLGFDLDETRVDSIIKYMYKKFNHNGILYQRQSEIKRQCHKENIITAANDPVIQLMLKCLVYIEKDGIKYYTTRSKKEKEEYIEKFCEKLQKCDQVKIKYDSNELKTLLDTQLDSKQRAAIEMALENNISIITGAPGTGKTYVIATVCELSYLSKTLILAPTGAAVQKLKQDIRKKFSAEKNRHKPEPECRTIHSFLASSRQAEKCLYETIIIDEMSMVSLDLFYNLLKELSSRKISRILISGDANQLPSISGGNLMYDMVTYSTLPKTELNIQHRAEKRVINDNAQQILNGEDVQPDNNVLIFKEVENDDEIKTVLIEMLKKYNIKSENSCVLIPQRKKGVCTNAYNKILQDHYNEKQEKMISTNLFNLKKGDKTIYRKNDYKKKVYNGSIMTVNEYGYKKIMNKMEQKYLNNKLIGEKKYVGKKMRKNGDQYDHRIECFHHENEEDLREGEPVIFTLEELDNIELAYATTIHSAQGKGYETVIIILHSRMHKDLLTRKLFYTALTRSKKRCIIISNKKALKMCKEEDKPRITNLFQGEKKEAIQQDPKYLLKNE